MQNDDTAGDGFRGRTIAFIRRQDAPTPIQPIASVEITSTATAMNEEPGVFQNDQGTAL